MPTRLAIRIQECFDELTPGERTLATYILSHQHLVVGLTAAELARDAGTSKSTTVRFFRTLGYESFEAVRLQARGELNRLQPGGDPSEPEALARAGSPEAYVGQELTRVARTLEGFSSEALRGAVERLAGAERIWVAAFGDDAPLAPLAQSFLAPARAGVHLLVDGLTPMVNKLVSFGPRDTCLLITLGTRTPDAKFVVEQALSAGCGLLVMTSLSQPSPVGTHVVVRCHARTDGPDLSVTAAVSVLQFIARQVAMRLGDRAAARQALIETLRDANGARG